MDLPLVGFGTFNNWSDAEKVAEALKVAIVEVRSILDVYSPHFLHFFFVKRPLPIIHSLLPSC